MSVDTPGRDLSLERMAALTSGRDMWSTMPVEELSLPSVRMADGPMGIASGRVDERDLSLLTPCAAALAASWDPALAADIGALVGQEARARQVDVVLAPNVNLPRSPLAGRAFEMFSEDPVLTGLLASAWIAGLQRCGVGAAVKHFVANDSETDRHAMNSVVDEKALREVYFLPFEHCVKAGAWALMTAYNRINGTWCSSARELLSGVVKEDWGFDGVILSDWFGTHDTVGDASAGLDLEMPGPPRRLGPHFAEAVRAGAVDEARLEDAAERVIRLAERVRAARSKPLGEPDPAAQHDLLERAAIEGFVLLRNDGLLPLAPGQTSIAVIGPNAAEPCLQGGSFARIAVDPTLPTPAAAIAERFAPAEVFSAVGVRPDLRLPPLHAFDVRTPADEPGLLVEILDEDGRVVFSETRNTNLLIWFAEMPGLGELTRPGAVRVRTRFKASKPGSHRFYYGGTGATALIIDGKPKGLRDPNVAPADIMGELMRRESAHVDLELQAGEALDLEILMRFNPARAQGVWCGCRAPMRGDPLAEAVALADQAQSVVLMVGESQDGALESVDRVTTHLPPEQVELIARVCEANPRTVVVVNAARPVALDWADKAAAVLHVWFPGQGFAGALAKVLAGDAEPGGRLPVSFARSEQDYTAFSLTPQDGDLVYAEGSLVGYRGMLHRGIAARYPFGFGLGYADIALLDVVMEGDGEGPSFKASLRNAASRDGKAVVQLYLEVCEPGQSGYGAPRLVGFAAVRVAGGAAAEVRLTPDALAARTWDSGLGCWGSGAQRRYSVGLSSQDRPYRFEAAL